MKRLLLFILINLVLTLLALSISGRLFRFPDTSLMSIGVETLLFFCCGLLTLPVYGLFRRKDLRTLCITLAVFTLLVMLATATSAKLTALYFETGSRLSFLKEALRVFQEGLYKGILFVFVLHYRPYSKKDEATPEIRN